MIKNFLFVPIMVFATFGTATVASTVSAEAGQYCKEKQSCKEEVRRKVAAQDFGAANGKRWGPVSPSQCAIASRQQEANERRCRGYDSKAGGKTKEECAKCYRQVREDLARWIQCHKIGEAPPVPAAIYASLARLGQAAE